MALTHLAHLGLYAGFGLASAGLSGCDANYEDCLSIPATSPQTRSAFEEIVQQAANEHGFVLSDSSNLGLPSWREPQYSIDLTLWETETRIGIELHDISGPSQAAPYEAVYDVIKRHVQERWSGTPIQEGGCAAR